MIRNLMIAALVAGSCGVATTEAREYNLSRQEIKQMPILERPSRPGHFYGNTVRRMNSRKVEQAHPTNPWQGYTPGRSQVGGYGQIWIQGH